MDLKREVVGETNQESHTSHVGHAPLPEDISFQDDPGGVVMRPVVGL